MFLDVGKNMKRNGVIGLHSQTMNTFAEDVQQKYALIKELEQKKKL